VSRLPSLRAEEVIMALRRGGFEIGRQRGSHVSGENLGQASFGKSFAMQS